MNTPREYRQTPGDLSVYDSNGRPLGRRRNVWFTISPTTFGVILFVIAIGFFMVGLVTGSNLERTYQEVHVGK